MTCRSRPPGLDSFPVWVVVLGTHDYEIPPRSHVPKAWLGDVSPNRPDRDHSRRLRKLWNTVLAPCGKLWLSQSLRKIFNQHRIIATIIVNLDCPLYYQCLGLRMSKNSRCASDPTDNMAAAASLLTALGPKRVVEPHQTVKSENLLIPMELIWINEVAGVFEEFNNLAS